MILSYCHPFHTFVKMSQSPSTIDTGFILSPILLENPATCDRVFQRILECGCSIYRCTHYWLSQGIFRRINFRRLPPTWPDSGLMQSPRRWIRILETPKCRNHTLERVTCGGHDMMWTAWWRAPVGRSWGNGELSKGKSYQYCWSLSRLELKWTPIVLWALDMMKNLDRTVELFSTHCEYYRTWDVLICALAHRSATISSLHHLLHIHALFPWHLVQPDWFEVS